jgi:hypothetical protein
MLKKAFIYITLVILIFSCEDKVNEFNGFTQIELEFLLSSDGAKAWERISKEEDGEEIIPGECDMDNYLIFVPGDIGEEKPLLYAYNPSICDSMDFCTLHPDFCQADTMNCNADPDFCELISDEVLYIGSWYAKEPFIENDRSDTLVFSINNKKESIHVTNITSQYATFLYKGTTGTNGGLITENYKYTPQ